MAAIGAAGETMGRPGRSARAQVDKRALSTGKLNSADQFRRCPVMGSAIQDTSRSLCAETVSLYSRNRERERER